MIIKFATSSDLKKIAKCHIAAFPNSLTSKMGSGVIVKMFNWYLSDTNKFLIWIEEGKECVGYCGGYIMDGRDSYGAASGMMQYAFSSIVFGILRNPWLLFHLEIQKKFSFFMINLLRKFRSKKIVVNNEINSCENIKKLSELKAGLIVIGVAPNTQLRGLGTILIRKFECYCKSNFVKMITLTVNRENLRAINAYKKNGFFIVFESDSSFQMTKTLHNDV